jgi:hypothetical protein
LALNVSPTSELGDDQKLAFDLAGTVALPSPFPAAGRVLLVRLPAPDRGREGGRRPRFVIKIVQVVNEKQLFTAFVHPHDVRAIRVHSGAGSPADLRSWSFVSGEDLRAALEDAIDELGKPDFDTGGSFEAQLYEQAIVYVPETAQLLARVEYGVPAGVAVAIEVPAMRHCPPREPGLAPLEAAVRCPPR